MNIEDLTIGQAKKLSQMFSKCESKENYSPCNGMIGKKVIIRTAYAGVHFGTLAEKDGAEVILSRARRMWQWKSAKSISLSGCANYGIDQSGSKIAPEVESIWLEAIEIIPCTQNAIDSIEEAKDAKAQ